MESHKAPKTVSSDTRNTEDILSNLPEAIIHHNFSFLETVDVRLEALKLNLENGQLKLPRFAEFSRIRTLHLVKVDLLDDDEMAIAPSKDINIKAESIACLTSHLKIVKLNYIEGIRNHLELIRFLLKNGNVLEKIVVAGLDDLEEMGETKQMLMEFPRASASPELVFLQSGPRGVFSEFCDYEI
ncbi:hypothetical protein L6164_003523 [Bauhinia variegata]|uniref:Uncharacterized protein n=1 Tax=Bauhinia variegata TaxID=167791 RepID=A0ACB9Q491_BAUVA|nr:hypothetical protein L6164_003523 [Bauhinia variegata]